MFIRTPLICLVLTLVSGLATAAPATKSSSVTATIRPSTGKNSVKIVGFQNGTVDSFLGIPFAEPPVGSRRFTRPQAKVYQSSVLNATTLQPRCMQQGGDATAPGMSEDCLTINVITPHGACGSSKKLPVMVWIYGGGFVNGSASSFTFPDLPAFGIEIGKPFVLAAANYRLGMFGFPQGADAVANNAANLGLYDQRLSLEWVKHNIASFGGDPTKVTVFGESAGAMSIATHMLNETQDLFRGAILHSGGPNSSPLSPTTIHWAGAQNMTAQNAGCLSPNTTNLGQNMTTWECLKTVDANLIISASKQMMSSAQYAGVFPWSPSIDGVFVPELPSKLLKEGRFARMPFISGNCRDEGTVFTPSAINATSGPAFMHRWYPQGVTDDVLNTLLAHYPNDPANGSPYGTGNETFGLDPSFKQYAALLGDQIFQSRRRYLLRTLNQHKFTNTWAFEFRANETAAQATYRGVAHGSDVSYIFLQAADVAMSREMMVYEINFAYDLDPNGAAKTGNSSLYWPQHQYPANKNIMRMDSGNFTLQQDTLREDQMIVFDDPAINVAIQA